MRQFSLADYQQLLKNGSPEKRGRDHIPVVKLFFPTIGCTWLLTEIDTEFPFMAFGLSDLGLGYPELGSVNLEELASFRVEKIFSIEKDLTFKAKYPLSVYTRTARRYETIIEDEAILEKFVIR